MNGTKYMHHDARGERGPYTAKHALGPWYCMVPEGVHVSDDSPVLQYGAGRVPEQDRELYGQVGWASDRSLRNGRDSRGIGWEQV